jgi:phosphoribosylformylglycinamidine synthase
MNLKFGIVVFPGSNCDHDAYYSLKNILGYDATFLWHKDTDLQNCNIIILPGGFSYGDYLRSGAIAKLSPIMNSIIKFANNGGFIIGICNGFQVLTESGLLPGVLLKNNSLKFVCRDVYLSVDNYDTKFTKMIEQKILKIPIAHGEGNYFADEDTIKSLEDNNQIVFKYCTPDGLIDHDSNPNGSLLNIAGITNKNKNVLGMMPHPERCCNPILGNTDGALIFQSIYKSLINGR